MSCSILPYPALTICVLCSILSMFMDFGWLWELDSAVYMIHIVYMEYLFCLGIKVDCFCFFFWIWLCVEHKGFELFARGKILWSWSVFDRAKIKQIGWCQVLWQIIVPLLKLLVLLYQVIIEKGTCMFVFHFLVYLEVDDV